jgi:hypothetical protein
MTLSPARVHFHRTPEPERLVWEEELVTGSIDHDRIRAPQIIELPEQHGVGRAHQRRVI